MTEAQSPDTVGWLFIQQYYTKLNAQPEKLHQFYTRASTMLHGAEGDALTVAHGQAEVQQRVSEEHFKDCKVVVSTVDCLPSQNGGVLVQVLGEMAPDQARHPYKFAQTFFLAAQPGGYFVLNDILRLLKDDSDDESEDEIAGVPEQEAVAQVAEVPQVNGANGAAAPNGYMNGLPLPVIPNAEQIQSHTPAQYVQAPQVVEVPQTLHMAPAHVQQPPQIPPVAQQVESVPAQPKQAAEPQDNTANSWGAKTSWANVVSQSTTAPQVQAPAQATAPAPAPAPAQIPTQPEQTQAKPARTPKTNEQKPRENRDKAPREHRVFFSAYVKIPEDIDTSALRAALEGIGKITHLQIEPEKNRTFVDFVDQATLDKALALRELQAGRAKVIIEERKRKKSQKKD